MKKLKLIAVGAMAIGILGASSMATYANDEGVASQLVASIELEAIDANTPLDMENVEYLESVNLEGALTSSIEAIPADGTTEMLNVKEGVTYLEVVDSVIAE